jgi:K(+)-stimulated pyrophosphate-energized sodium pump
MTLFYLTPVASVVALVFALKFYKEVEAREEGTERMAEIAQYVREGAYAYLAQQYKVVTYFFVGACIFLTFLAFGLHVQSKWVPFAFLTGGFFSALAGFVGMKTATMASARTTNAARESLNQGLVVAFRAGAVMGLSVVGLALLDISVWFWLLHIYYKLPLHEVTTTMLAFGMGASSYALFARVGGGIFTKAADVGADLVGKVEAGIPEDDPRNPATIADNVGDNVGDVAGMGADLYESYAGSILATAALGVAGVHSLGLGEAMQLKFAVLPMIIASVGVLFSILGVYVVHTKEGASQKELLGALAKGVNVSSALIVVGAFFLVKLVLPEDHFGIFYSIIAGLVSGILIGWSTEYYTSADYAPTQGVAEQTKTGAATVIIDGIGTGMESTAAPVLIISVGILCAYGAAGGFANPSMGLYGVGIAAVGMLSTLGLTLATDAYGPIADNAGGNAEMSGLGEEVRERTDALDSLGNTTAATGKGFAIGSAALTALALLAAYIEEVRAGLGHAGIATLPTTTAFPKGLTVATASMKDFITYYDVTIMNPAVLIGLFCGSMLCFLFCALTMKAVGRAAGEMVEEVRRQFREIEGIMEGTGKPDYQACVTISTHAAQREMVLPSMIAILSPVVVGLLLGVAGVMGLLSGGLATGFVLAIFMANAGGSWDNAKKYVETGKFGGKGSDNHKAAIVGDTVGDPFKDTAGPSLNILIKLMSMVSVVVAGLVVKYNLFAQLVN